MNVPASIETAYLGGLIIAAKGASAPALFLEPAEFSEERHQLIYAALDARKMDEEPLSASLLIGDLAKTNSLGIVGGESYIETLADIGRDVSLTALDQHARTIRKFASLQRLRDLAAHALTLSDEDGAADSIDDIVKYLVSESEIVRSRAQIGGRVEFSTVADLGDILGDIEWLWEGWILRGYVTAIVAQQEQGKSNVALDLMGRMLNSGDWPDQTPTGIAPNSKVLLIDTEMALGGVYSRCQAWGLPMDRIILPPNPLHLLKLDKPADWQWIENVTTQAHPVAIVVDALSGSHNSDENNNDAMKVVLQRLSMLAQTHKLAVPAIHHTRKAGVGEPDWPLTLDRVRGASAITQFCRSIIALGTPDKSQPTLRRFESIKSNFAPKPEPLGYEITDHGLAWGSAPEIPVSANPIEGARAFLLDYLSQNQSLATDVTDAATEEGISSSTLQRASRELRIKKRKETGGLGRSFWSLPGYKPDQSEAA